MVFNIFMVVIGLIIVGISYVISEKVVQREDGTKILDQKKLENRVLSSEEKQNVKNQMMQIMEETAFDIEAKTSDRLAQISNEKIMSVSEMSEQILDKIDHNHTEVVFLYDMLNEKEEQLKIFAKEINQIQKSQRSDPTTSNIVEKDLDSEEKSEDKTQNNINQMDELVQKSMKLDLDHELRENPSESTWSNNEMVLNLYNQGMSILEISKKLGLGQGEVKLVIDLLQFKS